MAEDNGAGRGSQHTWTSPNQLRPHRYQRRLWWRQWRQPTALRSEAEFLQGPRSQESRTAPGRTLPCLFLCHFKNTPHTPGARRRLPPAHNIPATDPVLKPWVCRRSTTPLLCSSAPLLAQSREDRRWSYSTQPLALCCQCCGKILLFIVHVTRCDKYQLCSYFEPSRKIA